MTIITTIGISASAIGLTHLEEVFAYAETCYSCDEFLPMEGYRNTCYRCV